MRPPKLYGVYLIDEACRNLLEELNAIRSSGGAVKETSYYPALSNLLNEVGKTLKPRVRCIINIQNAGAGLPDGGLYAAEQFQKQAKGSLSGELREGQLPARGAIEVKSTGEEVKNIARSEQVMRYVNRYKQVLVTNYRDFVLVGVDHEGKVTNRESFSLAAHQRGSAGSNEHRLLQLSRSLKSCAQRRVTVTSRSRVVGKSPQVTMVKSRVLK